MAGSLIIPVCASCGDTGDGRGGLRTHQTELLCATCRLMADFVTAIGYAARQAGWDEDAYLSLAAFCSKGIQLTIDPPDEFPVAPVTVTYADN